MILIYIEKRANSKLKSIYGFSIKNNDKNM